ncbi:hypothetical protein COLO4_13257 [Corchorus olitorius]|uniref:Uncharacterized protein n=1 Tax=Corchorus olitorius TaxID=93759 RepID=A0A1R3JX75_9ROSI|nr:hypothetical protein COLO4_13257 [Corchorus olitorius]
MVLSPPPPLDTEMFAKLAPNLRELEFLSFDRYYTWSWSYFDKLEALTCSASNLHILASGKSIGIHIHTLRLFGTINDYAAKLIGTSFPLLKHLEIPSCILSVNALPIILDGHKNLLTLDTRHCFLASDKKYLKALFYLDPDPTNPNPILLKALEWELEEEHVQGVKVHLQCKRRLCSK